MGSNGRNRGNPKRKVVPLKTPKVLELEKMLRRWASMGEHHIFPVCRGGSDRADNKKDLPPKIHGIYHEIFGEASPEEAVIILLLLMRGRKRKWTGAEVDSLSEAVIEGDLQKARQLANFNKGIEALPFRLSEAISKKKVTGRKLAQRIKDGIKKAASW